MKYFYFATIAMALSAMAATANNTQDEAHGLPDITKFVYKKHSKGMEFSTFGCRDAAGVTPRFMTRAGVDDGGDTAPAPEFTLGPSTTCGDIDGPDGQLLFYQMSLDYDYIEHEYYTEKILNGYSLEIFDTDHNLVGSISDKVLYAEDEKRTVYCDITPLVTRHFFNGDDNLEVIISLVINSTTPGYNHERSVVYSLGGEKSADGYDVPVMVLPEIVADVLDASAPGGEENYYITFMNEQYSEYDGSEDYWANLLKSKVGLSVYTKADAGGELQKVFDYDIRMVDLPGDQEYSPFVLSLVHGGKGYFVFSHYGDSLFNPYDFMDYDVTQREENTLVVDIYEVDGSAAKRIQSTTIPFTKDSGDGLLASFYSVGGLRYTGDINFDDYGTADGQAALIVSKGNQSTTDDESLSYSYYIYNPDGTLRTTIVENTSGTVGMTDIDGCETQQMFITIDDLGQYVYRFIDLVSCKEAFSMSYLMEVDGSDPDPITVNIDRVPEGDSYVYAAEMFYPVEEDDISFMRVAWFDSEGQYLRTDEINMGEDVRYATSNIDGVLLRKGVIMNSGETAYMILIKRGLEGTATQEELLIAEACSDENPYGREIMLLKPCEKGNIASVIAFSHIGVPLLMVVYADGDSNYTADFYRLPLDGMSGISPIIAAGTTGAIRFDGSTVSADGFIEIFDISGMRVASGNSSVDLSGVASGILIVRSGENIAKIVVK